MSETAEPLAGEISIPHHSVDDPDFLYAALDTAACAAFIKESRMNFANPRISCGA
jgi:hypothetical protein